MLDRRAFLSLTAALAARHASAAATDPIASPIAEYDAQGFHRTGTAADHASAEWLAGLVRARGLTPKLEPFPISRVDPQTCFIEAGGHRVEGVPMFNGSFTDAAGVHGDIGPVGGDSAIGWVELAPNGEGAEIAEVRKSGKHRAIVVVTKGATPGLCLINVPGFRHPFGPPVLQIPSQEADWMRQLASAKTEATLVAQVKRADVEALNVVAILKGEDPSLPPVVVMTPRSGWWQCASERGGGIACWLEVMNQVRRPARDFIYIATSGHELGHLGLESFTEKNPKLIAEARAWIHFGANIGAAKGPTGTLQSSDETLGTLGMREITASGLKVNRRPAGQIPNGEAGNIHRGGGKYLSLIGGNDLFHNPLDRWPDAVNTAALDGFAQAFARAAIVLSQS
jgi:hypothetical protein